MDFHLERKITSVTQLTSVALYMASKKYLRGVEDDRKSFSFPFQDFITFYSLPHPLPLSRPFYRDHHHTITIFIALHALITKHVQYAIFHDCLNTFLGQ